jgi:hypothetical protein
MRSTSPETPAEIQTISRWLIYLHLGATKFGEAGFEKRLRDLCGYGAGDHFVQIKDCIFSQIYKYYGVSKKQLTASKSRGTLSEPRTMAIILMQRHLRLTLAEIARIFHVDLSLVSKRITSFDNREAQPLSSSGQMLQKMYSNKEFMRNYETINETLYKFRAQHTNT